MANDPTNDVLDTARELMGRTLPKQVQDTLDAWVRGRLAEGIDPAELTRMMRGESDLEVSHGTLLAEATGSAALLDSTVPAISALVADGEQDGILGELLAYEHHTAGRKGVLRALEQRVAVHETEMQVDATLAQLEQDLADGHLDGDLEDLLALERSRKDRKGAIQLYEDRMAVRSHLRVLDGTVDELRSWLDAHPDAPREAMLQAEQSGKARISAVRLLRPTD